MLLGRVTKIEKHGEYRRLQKMTIQHWWKLNKKDGYSSAKVLAMAYKVIDTLPETVDTGWSNMI